MEYLPCFGHQILSNRLEKLKYEGIYITPDGTKEYYKPLTNEIKLYEDIENRLQTDY